MKINEYDKINELSNFKCNLAGYINKIIDTAIELSSLFSKKKDSFSGPGIPPQATMVALLYSSIS